MAGYLVAHITVTNPEGFQGYRDKVPAVIESFGGRYLIRGGQAEAVEGDWSVPRLVVIEFPSTERARAFYNSAAYQEILPLRLENSSGTLAFVEGV